jgi:hypothetical protein
LPVTDVRLALSARADELAAEVIDIQDSDDESRHGRPG